MKLVTLTLMFTNLLLLGVRFGLSLHRSSDGQILYDLQIKSSDLRHTNQLLENQVEQLSSVSALADRAKAAGLVPLKTTTLGSDSVALAHQVQ